MPMPAGGTEPVKLSVVLSTHPAQFAAATFKGDFAANVAQIAALGYDGVELAIRDPRLVHADDLLRVLDANRLAVPAIGTGQAWGEEGLSFTDPDPAVRAAAIGRLKSHVPLAARLSAVVIVGLLRGTVKPGVSQPQAMAWLVAALQECCAVASAAGVRVALEPINRYETTLVNTIGQGLELLAAVGAANLGLLADTFHMNIEEPSIAGSIQAAGGRISHFHVADSNRWHPGAGHLDFSAILQALFATGYNGFVGGEFLPLPDAETAARRGIAHLRGLRSSWLAEEKEV
jgi:sugar phosphate isomerase/epimerase